MIAAAQLRTRSAHIFAAECRSVLWPPPSVVCRHRRRQQRRRLRCRWRRWRSRRLWVRCCYRYARDCSIKPWCHWRLIRVKCAETFHFCAFVHECEGIMVIECIINVHFIISSLRSGAIQCRILHDTCALRLLVSISSYRSVVWRKLDGLWLTRLFLFGFWVISAVICDYFTNNLYYE